MTRRALSCSARRVIRGQCWASFPFQKLGHLGEICYKKLKIINSFCTTTQPGNFLHKFDVRYIYTCKSERFSYYFNRFGCLIYHLLGLFICCLFCLFMACLYVCARVLAGVLFESSRRKPGWRFTAGASTGAVVADVPWAHRLSVTTTRKALL